MNDSPLSAHDSAADPATVGAAMRLDRALVEGGLVSSRQRAQQAIRAGLVKVDGRAVTRPARLVEPGADLVVAGDAEPFVSRAGRKLAMALDTFGLDPHGATVLDVGASTGGFTDCLLQRGARHVYAVDVGHDQLHPSLRQDPRVSLYEGVNARALPPGIPPEPCTWVVVDLSFISLCKVLPALVATMAPGAVVVPLVKPQFEVGREGVGKGGVVRDEGLRLWALERCTEAMEELGIRVFGHCLSGVPGASGNREFFVHGRWREMQGSEVQALEIQEPGQ